MTLAQHLLEQRCQVFDVSKLLKTEFSSLQELSGQLFFSVFLQVSVDAFTDHSSEVSKMYCVRVPLSS